MALRRTTEGYSDGDFAMLTEFLRKMRTAFVDFVMSTTVAATKRTIALICFRLSPKSFAGVQVVDDLLDVGST
jgi:hypothetical protein